MVTENEKGTLGYLVRNERSWAGYYVVESEKGKWILETCKGVCFDLHSIDQVEYISERLDWAEGCYNPSRSFTMIKQLKYPVEKGFKSRSRFMTSKMSMDEVLEKVPELKGDIENELRGWGFSQNVKLWCLHCGRSFMSSSIRHCLCCYSKPMGLIESRYLCCPTKDCDSNPMDWDDKGPWKV